MDKKLLFISVICVIAGFVFAYLTQGEDAAKSSESNKYFDFITASISENKATENKSVADNERLTRLENEVSSMKQQLQNIELTLKTLNTAADSSSPESPVIATAKNRYSSTYNQRIYTLANLIKGGIDPIVAEDIVRRKNSIELKRLELQDYATRNDYLNTQRYLDELEVINSADTSLREELGDQRYDEYLYNSKQNNRVRISSVMLGSPAELAGIESGDIVLSYNDNRIFTWQELKDATAEGQLGEYVSISIYRNGEIYSFSVPRGTLGMQLGATRLQP